MGCLESPVIADQPPCRLSINVTKGGVPKTAKRPLPLERKGGVSGKTGRKRGTSEHPRYRARL